jgi:hypothetical protein
LSLHLEHLNPEQLASASTQSEALSVYDQLRTAGLEVEVIGRLDYFSGSVSADTRRVAQGFGAHTVVLRGVKPG